MELGRFDEAARFAETAQELCKSADVDHYIYFNSLAGLTYLHALQGEKRKAFEGAKRWWTLARNTPMCAASYGVHLYGLRPSGKR